MPLPHAIESLNARYPHGFWAGQERETEQGSFPHFNRAGPDRVSSLRL
jgi:hypothetical protein